jgi:hypothetical protein
MSPCDENGPGKRCGNSFSLPAISGLSGFTAVPIIEWSLLRNQRDDHEPPHRSPKKEERATVIWNRGLRDSTSVDKDRGCSARLGSRAAAVSQLVKPVSRSGRQVGRGTEALKRREEKVEGENEGRGARRSFIYPCTHRDSSTPNAGSGKG